MTTRREDTLRGWVKPPSDNEDGKRDKTEGQIKKALSASPRLKGVQYKVYAKGSYANNTNVRLNYDMDIAVECTEFCYHEVSSSASSKKDAIDAKFRPYGKEYGLIAFKADIEAALVEHLGRTAVTRGKTLARCPAQGTALGDLPRSRAVGAPSTSARRAHHRPLADDRHAGRHLPTDLTHYLSGPSALPAGASLTTRAPTPTPGHLRLQQMAQ